MNTYEGLHLLNTKQGLFYFITIHTHTHILEALVDHMVKCGGYFIKSIIYEKAITH